MAKCTHHSQIGALALHPTSGTQLVSGAADAELRVWDITFPVGLGTGTCCA